MSHTVDRDAVAKPPGRLTAQEYFQLPAGPPYSQLIDGELIISPSPDFHDQDIVVRLAILIGGHVRKHRLGKLIVAPSDVQFDEENVFQPDLYFVRKERQHIIQQQGPKGAPDLVVEIISRRTRRVDLGRKKEISAREGVIEYWAVYPQRKRIEIYRLRDDVETPAKTYGGDDVLESEMFRGLKISLPEIFDED